MKKNILLYLVIFSLALNFGTIGTLFYLHYQGPVAVAVRPEQPPLPLRALWRELQLDDSQRQTLRRLFPGHHQKVRQLRTDLGKKRLELLELLQGEAPAWEAVQAKVKEISGLQGSLEEEMLRFLLETKKNLRPEQQAVLLRRVQARLGCPEGPPGDACEPMGSGRGRMRGGGPGPGHGGMGPGGPGGMGPGGPGGMGSWGPGGPPPPRP